MRERDALFIGGAWVRPSAGDVIEVGTPPPRRSWGVPDGVGRPTSTAPWPPPAAAFDGWAGASVEERAKLLQGMHDAMVAG